MEFARRVSAMYGKSDGWAKEAQYAASKSNEFRAALLEVLEQNRPMEMGPPSVEDMMDLAEDAAKRMDAYAPPPLRGGPEAPSVTWEMIKSWPIVEDARGDGWLSRRQVSEAMGLIMTKLAGKVVKA